MSRARIRILLLAVVGWGVVVGAQAAPHRIQPGDQLRIVVLERPELTQEVVVQDNGEIVYFVLGAVQAAGKTPEVLAQEIRAGLSSYVRDAEVIVVPRIRENEVYIAGMVKQPGRYTFRGQQITIRQALALAGDVAPEGADLRRVVLVRPDRPPQTVDLTADRTPPVAVERGDLVYVPSLVRITVTGNVRDPSSFWVEEPISLGYALARAGGLTENGSLDRIVILRRSGAIETVSVPEDFWAVNGENVPYLYHGDAVYVGNAYRVEEVSVLGYVRNPGMHPVRGPIPVGRAIALAGGMLTDQAKLDEVTILRLNGTQERVDLRQGATTVLVYPGETVRVDRRFQINWPLMFSFLSTAALVWRLVNN